MGISGFLRRLDRRVSVAVKVGVPVVVISVASSVLFGALSVSEATQRVNARYTSEAADISLAVADAYTSAPEDIAAMNLFLLDLSSTHPAVARTRVVKEGFGRFTYVWASSNASELGAPITLPSLPGEGRSERHYTKIGGESVLAEVSGTAMPGGVVAIVVYFSLEPRDQAVESVTKRILVESLAVLLFQLLALGSTMYLTVIRRLKRLGHFAEVVAGGDLSVRLPEGRLPAVRDELTNVAREFDLMVEALDEHAMELANAAERQRLAADKLRELDRVKNTLLHAVSHDLRGPITSILGSARTLQRADELKLSDEDRNELIGGLTSGARKMHRLVADLLDLDRLDRGMVTPKRHPTDIGELVRRVIEELGFSAGGRLHVEVSPVTIAVDAAQIERVVENLIGNTIKHTPSGTEVWVRVSPYELGALIRVEDSGPGVPRELWDTIFEPFKQGTDEGMTPGVGIGLSLVSRFAELHGGRAWIADREGGGASFNAYIADGEPEPDDEEDEGDAARIGLDRGGRSSIG